MLILLVLVAATSSQTPVDQLAKMTALYEQVCLRTFPDDAAVASAMIAMNARELSAEDVRITMHDDPARAWALQDGSATVWIEYPPFHACSVRWSSPSVGDLSAYRDVADRYQRAVGGFAPIKPMEADHGAIHVYADGEQRTLPDKSTEAMFVFRQHITDQKRRESGETGFNLRFVHQFAAAAN